MKLYADSEGLLDQFSFGSAFFYWHWLSVRHQAFKVAAQGIACHFSCFIERSAPRNDFWNRREHDLITAFCKGLEVDRVLILHRVT
jgi:hypothetical protein